MGIRRKPVERTYEFTVTNEAGDDVVFIIRSKTVADVIFEGNRGSMLEYVLGEDNRVVATRREMPFGDIQFERVLSRLVGWNLEDEDGKIIPVTAENVKKYVSPYEFSLLVQHLAEEGE